MFIRELSARYCRTMRPGFWACIFVILLFTTGIAQAGQALTLNAKYPGFATGILGSAKLEPMNEETLLIADGVEITRVQLKEAVDQQKPRLRRQLEKNLLFILEQEAARRILVSEAKKAGIPESGEDENQSVQELLERKTADVSVSEKDLKVFYEQNRKMVGGAPFEQVKDGIRQYLLQDKKKRAVLDYIDELGDSANLRINEGWVKMQNVLAMDNPVDQARQSGKPTMVEFGAAGCAPCDMMQPVLENLRKNYPEKLNIVFVHVGEEQVLAARYGIRSIPVQVFFDATGKEAFRHVGFFAESEVTKQLARMGVVR